MLIRLSVIGALLGILGVHAETDGIEDGKGQPVGETLIGRTTADGTGLRRRIGKGIVPVS